MADNQPPVTIAGESASSLPEWKKISGEKCLLYSYLQPSKRRSRIDRGKYETAREGYVRHLRHIFNKQRFKSLPRAD
jgi:hypothetical protein